MVSLQPPLPLPILRVRATVLTFFMNEDHTSLINFCSFVALNEPNCLLCCVYGNDGDLCHPSQNCPLLLNGYRCFKYLRPHLRAYFHNSIPHHLTIVPSATFCTMDMHWVMSHYMKEGMVLIAHVRSRVNDTQFFFGSLGVATHQTCIRPCQN